MDDWREVILEEIADDVTVGHVGPMAAQYCDEGIPFLRSLSVEPFRITKEGLRYISADFHARLQKSALAPGDVVIVRTGKPGACAVIPDWLPVANCSDLVIIRCSKAIRPRYLCYVVNSIASRHIDAHLVGAVQQHFNVGSARTLRFRLPRLDNQDAILNILGALDDKIELNRRMNATLVAMARAIFKDWFVDFGPTRAKAEDRPPYLAPDLWALFPDALDDDDKPVGWEFKSLSSILIQHKETISPSGYPVEIFDHYSIPAFDQQQMPALDAGENILSNKTLVPTESILLSKLNPEISRVWLPRPKSIRRQIASTEFLVFVPNKHFGRAFLFCLFKDHIFRQRLEGMVTGTSKSHQRVTPPSLLALELTVPPRFILTNFERVCWPLMERILQNREENQTLAQTRDLLLPKLMSGEIRLRDAEKAVEAVA